MRICPRCSNTAVLEDGYCGVCRECTVQPANPVSRPIVSAWLPIVQGEVTFPCVWANFTENVWATCSMRSAIETDGYKHWTHWHPLSPFPEQLSPGEKAWAEYCREQGIQCPDSRAQAAVKSTFMAGRASIEGDNERK
jgi:hypothetical protein